MAHANPATADEAEPIPVAVLYDAPADCPTVRDLVARISVRVPVSLSQQPEADVEARVEARIDEVAGEIVAHLRLEQEGNVTEREVVGETCDEVVSALAVITAVSLDVPEVETQGDEEPLSPAVPPPTPAPVTIEMPPSPPSPPSPAPVGSRASVDFRGGVAVKTAVAPDAVVGFHAQARLVPADSTFAVAIGGTLLDSDSVSTRAGTAHFRLRTAELRGCPWLWSRGPVQVGPCASLELGGLQGTGHSTEHPASQTGWWLAPGVIADWRVRLGPFLLATAAGPGFPLVRDRFYFELKGDGWSERVLVHQPPRVDWRAEMLVGVAIPNK